MNFSVNTGCLVTLVSLLSFTSVHSQVEKTLPENYVGVLGGVEYDKCRMGLEYERMLLQLKNQMPMSLLALLPRTEDWLLTISG